MSCSYFISHLFVPLFTSKCGKHEFNKHVPCCSLRLQGTAQTESGTPGSRFQSPCSRTRQGWGHGPQLTVQGQAHLQGPGAALPQGHWAGQRLWMHSPDRTLARAPDCCGVLKTCLAFAPASGTELQTPWHFWSERSMSGHP